MTAKKFLRRDARRFSKFGKGRGRKAKWKKPTGRDNKMREKRKGYPQVVGIGNRNMKKSRGKLENKTPVFISNPKSLEKIKKNEIGVVKKVGLKTKIEIAKKAKEMKIPLKNMNPESFLKINERKPEQKTREGVKNDN